MAVELQQLLLAVLLGALHLVVYGVIANIQLGVRYTSGPRDEPPAGLSPAAARLGRAWTNFGETLPWFAIAVVVTHLAQKVDEVTIAAGWVYLAARLVYLPAYVINIPLTRSLIWMIATFAVLTIVVRALG